MTDLDFSLEPYDFADFGCRSGRSMTFAKAGLGGNFGIGLDGDPKKIEALRLAGFDAQVVDFLELDHVKVGKVKFVNVSHLLQTLPNPDIAAKCIRSAVGLASDFVFICQPCFDAEDYMRVLGLKPFWTDWHGHRNHMTSTDFVNILDSMIADTSIKRFILFKRKPIVDSNDPVIHSIVSNPDQQLWDPRTHPPKRYFDFKVPIYREIGAVLKIENPELSGHIARYLGSCDVTRDASRP